MNGAAPVITTYNLDNQITSGGVSYDLAGNLTNDGTAASTFDALNRMTTRGGTTYGYNGDGALVSQVTGGVTTRYTQDLLSPLTQVLQSFTGATRTDYLYGANRLATLTSGVATWYASDALGSVRRTVSAAGVPQGVINYDPWGTVESGSVPTFGFTGELQQGGLVNLRARWYHAGQGRFGSRDPFAGAAEQPYSVHPYQYAYSAPTVWTDPSGRVVSDGGEGGSCTPANLSRTDPRGVTPGDCRVPPPRPQPKRRLVPTQASANVCPPTPDKPLPLDLGYIEGISGVVNLTAFTGQVGVESVYDLYDFEYARFFFAGGGAYIVQSPIDLGATFYTGALTGWRKYHAEGSEPGVLNYSGVTLSGSLTVPIPFIPKMAGTIQYFRSGDGNLQGVSGGIGLSVDPLKIQLPGAVGGGVTYAVLLDHRVFRSGRYPSMGDAMGFLSFLASNPEPDGVSMADKRLLARSVIAGLIIVTANEWEKVKEIDKSNTTYI